MHEVFSVFRKQPRDALNGRTTVHGASHTRGASRDPLVQNRHDSLRLLMSFGFPDHDALSGDSRFEAHRCSWLVENPPNFVLRISLASSSSSNRDGCDPHLRERTE